MKDKGCEAVKKGQACRQKRLAACNTLETDAIDATRVHSVYLNEQGVRAGAVVTEGIQQKRRHSHCAA